MSDVKLRNEVAHRLWSSFQLMLVLSANERVHFVEIKYAFSDYSLTV